MVLHTIVSIMSTDKFFLYARKSSEEEERQILSIEAQLAELRVFAQQNDIHIVREYTESQSAKEPGRPVFNEMVGQMEKGIASGIIAWHPDRLARNSIDGGRIVYLVDTGKIVSLKFPTFWFEPTPQGKFMLSVAFGQAKYYTDNLRENILRGIRQKIRRGEFSGKAPMGYFNEPRLRTIEPDPKTFSKVKEVLELFATGNYTLTTIRDKMFSLGLTGRDGRPPHLSTITHLLTKSFYYGMFIYNGEMHEGSHKPMISKKTFDRIQQALKDHGKPRKNRDKKPFMFLGFARCGECGYMMTAERKVKPSGRQYVYYRCTKKSKTQTCGQNRFLREDRLAAQIGEAVQNLSLSDEWREKFLAKVNIWEQEERHSSDPFVHDLKAKITENKAKLDRLTDAMLDGSLDAQEFKDRKNVLMAEKADLQGKLAEFERTGSRWVELTRNWIMTGNTAENICAGENYASMRNFLRDVGSNPKIQNSLFTLALKNPFGYLYDWRTQNRGVAAAVVENSEMWTQGESDSRLRKANADTALNFVYFNVDPGRIGLPPPQCECGVIPLYYGPEREECGRASRTYSSSEAPIWPKAIWARSGSRMALAIWARTQTNLRIASPECDAKYYFAGTGATTASAASSFNEMTFELPSSASVMP